MPFILKTNNPDGFTMFEILVVMGVIAVLAALIVPRLGGTIYNLRLRSAVRKTSAVLRYIRSVAITTQQEQEVIFILNENPEDKDYYRYQRVTRKSGDQSERDDDVDLQDNPEDLKKETKKVELDAEISLSWRDGKDMDWEEQGRYEIIFSPRGFATGGEIRFALSDGKRAYILRVEPVTGRAEISTPEEGK